MIERELIEEIRQANDIASVVSGYVRLKRTGSTLAGLCPFHSEKTPSFHVMTDRQSFHCFGCGAGGNVITFVMMIENYDFVSAVKFLADRANITLEYTDGADKAKNVENAKRNAENRKKLYEIHKIAARFFYDCLKSETGKDATDYLKTRGLSPKIQVKCGLGYSPNAGPSLYGRLRDGGFDDELMLDSGLVIKSKTGNGMYDRFFGRLMFPIFDVSGKVTGFGGRTISDGTPKYLNSPETPIFEKGKLLYGLNFARNARMREIIVVEGYMDAIALYQAGFMNTVASLGTAFTSFHARLLKNYADRVILLYDSDDAGVKAVYKAFPHLVKAGLEVKVAEVENAKDPDEFIKKYGAERFSTLLESAKSHVAFQIDNERKRFDIAKLDQRVAFTKEASKILKNVESEIERDAYIKETARLTGISEEAIRSDADTGGETYFQTRTPRYTNKNVGDSTPQSVLKAQKRFLGLIASNLTAFEKSLPYISETDLTNDTYKELYGLIKEFYREGKPVLAEEVTSSPCFDTVDKQRQVSEILLAELPNTTIQELEKEFTHQIIIIKRYGIERKKRELGENIDEKAVQAAINQQKSLERLYISLTDG